MVSACYSNKYVYMLIKQVYIRLQQFNLCKNIITSGNMTAFLRLPEPSVASACFSKSY